MLVLSSGPADGIPPTDAAVSLKQRVGSHVEASGRKDTSKQNAELCPSIAQRFASEKNATTSGSSWISLAHDSEKL